MEKRALFLGTAMSVVLAAHANATIVGSTYTLATSSTGSTAIRDINNTTFCVGPPTTCSTGGMDSSFAFAQSSPTLDTITFHFVGSSSFGATGSFSADLNNIKTTDGETITAVALVGSGALNSGSFSTVSFNAATQSIDFTGDSGPFGSYNAVGGNTVVFDVTTSGPAPVPAPAIGAGIPGLLAAVGAFLFWRGRSLWPRQRSRPRFAA